MQSAWHSQTEQAISQYFDVELTTGLTQSEALKRLRHFGKNSDNTLPAGLEQDLTIAVIRDGKKQYIPLYQVVPGDVITLAVGDRVPADIRLFWVDAFSVNQSKLTGEPIAVVKNTYTVAESAPLAKQKNMAFMGSYVVSGSARGVVVERNSKTVLGRLPSSRRKRSVKGTVIARRLRRQGVRVLRKRSLAKFRHITHVLFDDSLSDAEILDIVRKVQLTRNINCRFAVSTQQATRLASTMQAGIYNAATKEGQLESSLFITNLYDDTDSSLHIVRSLQKKDTVVLWITNGLHQALGMRAADISLVTGRLARADIVLAADLYAHKTNGVIASRILYGKSRG